MYNVNWGFMEHISVNEASLALNSEIQKVLDFYAPIKVVKGSRKSKPHDPWFTPGLKSSSIRCFKMYQKVCHLPHDNAEFIRYKDYRKLYNKLRRQAKHNYYNKLISNNRYN